MVSVFGWPDLNTWDVARVKKSQARNHSPVAFDFSLTATLATSQHVWIMPSKTQKPLGISLIIIYFKDSWIRIG